MIIRDRVMICGCLLLRINAICRFFDLWKLSFLYKNPLTFIGMAFAGYTFVNVYCPD